MAIPQMMPPADAHPVPEEICEQLLQPFITATSLTLREWANTEAAVRAIYQTKQQRPMGDIAALLTLTSASQRTLALSFSTQTAATLAHRVLTNFSEDVDEGMIHDCLREIANVVAGQAKALLVGTPHHFTISIPTVRIGADAGLVPASDLNCLVVVFDSDVGEVVLQLFPKVLL